MLPWHPPPCLCLLWHPPPCASASVLPRSSSLRARAQACCHLQLHVTGGSAPDNVPTPAGTPAMLCTEGCAQGGQKTDGAAWEMALCSHPGQLRQLLPLGAPSSSPTKPQSTWLTPFPQGQQYKPSQFTPCLTRGGMGWPCTPSPP